MINEHLQFHLFVQEGCPKCHYVKRHLERVEGWEDAVIITQAKEDGKLTDFAKECGLRWIPTLKAIQDGKLVSEFSGAESMAKWFWTQVIKMYNEHRKTITHD